MAPDIRQQQQSALSQYAQGAASNGANVTAGNESPTTQFVKQSLAQIADLMAKVGKVLQVERPELIPVLKQMAGAGKTIETEFSKSQGQGSPAQPGADPSQTAPEAPETMGLN